MNRLFNLLIELEEIAEKDCTVVMYIAGKDMPVKDEDSFVYECDCRAYIYIKNGLKLRVEVKRFTHETAHVHVGICSIWTLPNINRLYEERACDWAAMRLVPHRELKLAMLDPHINSDYDMAEALEVEIDDIERARRRYIAMGYDVWRSDELW